MLAWGNVGGFIGNNSLPSLSGPKQIYLKAISLKTLYEEGPARHPIHKFPWVKNGKLSGIK